MLHHNLLLPCPYLVEEPNIHEPNLKKKINESNVEWTERRNNKHSRGIYLSDPDSSSEEEYPLWTRAKQGQSTSQ